MFKKFKRKKKGTERRKYRRISFKEIIGISIYKKKKVIKSLESGALSKDLSMSGLLFESKEQFPLHTSIQIELDISYTPNVKMVSIVGEIIRIEETLKEGKCEYGIRFVKVPKKDEIALENFIADYSTGGKEKKGFMDKKRKFLFHFFSSSGMSHSERGRGWFKIPKVRKRKILE